MSRYIITIGSEMIDVHLGFFENLDILKDEIISDTHFIKIKNGDSHMVFSIHKNMYDKVKMDLRNERLNSVLNN